MSVAAAVGTESIVAHVSCCSAISAAAAAAVTTAALRRHVEQLDVEHVAAGDENGQRESRRSRRRVVIGELVAHEPLDERRFARPPRAHDRHPETGPREHALQGLPLGCGRRRPGPAARALSAPCAAVEIPLRKHESIVNCSSRSELIVCCCESFGRNVDCMGIVPLKKGVRTEARRTRY